MVVSLSSSYLPQYRLTKGFFQAATTAETGPWIETVKIQAASKALRELEAINAPLMENWMNQWKF